MTTAYSYIRFSSPAQLRGDSLRRQLAKSEKFAAEQGLTLDTSHRDLGISAYKGTNRHKGALASFLAKIESGDIERGSYLIVENLDRLTREDVLSAVSLFLRIIEAGIIVATLNDDMIYSTQTIIDRPNDLTVSISAFIKGNREQKDKASRLKDAWDQKRSELGPDNRKKLTRQGPGWLDLVPDHPSDLLTGEWRFNDRAATVRRIFDLCIGGLGKELIARQLNAEGVPSFKHGDGWQPSTVALLLSDRRCIGELTLFTKVDGPRRPIGEPVKGYFPSVVSEETFYLAQSEIAKRHCGARAPKRDIFGKLAEAKVPNLFVRISRCGCGRTMEFRDKRSDVTGDSERARYLICSGAQRGHACTNKRHFTYGALETLVLDWVTDIQISDEDANRAGLASLKLSAKIAERDDLKRRVTDALAKWESATIDMIKDSLMASAERNAKAIQLVEAEIAELEQAASVTKRSVIDDRRAVVRKVRAQMESATGADQFEARAKLAAALRQAIDHIEFLADGSFRVTLKGGSKQYAFRDGKWAGTFEPVADGLKFFTADEKAAVEWDEGMRDMTETLEALAVKFVPAREKV